MGDLFDVDALAHRFGFICFNGFFKGKSEKEMNVREEREKGRGKGMRKNKKKEMREKLDEDISEMCECDFAEMYHTS